MTYCVAMSLDAGMIFASDSRTNAGVDQIARFSKMRVFAKDGDRVVVMLSSGNLSLTQNAINIVEQRGRTADSQPNLWNAASMFDVVRLLGDSLREVKSRDGAYLAQNNIDTSANFIVGGQIRGEPPRLFDVYSEGNFIEATPDTCYFQIGETKYGKPIIDRVLKRDTSPVEATKCTIVSFDSTMRSNISVGLPIDLVVYDANALLPGAGWIGLDPTSGLLAGEGHLPLACTAEPGNAAPVIGFTDVCETRFEFAMSVTRVHQDPRVTKPYDDAQWSAIVALGRQIDRDFVHHDVRLTQGGEPTFVAIDDTDGPEWNYTALSQKKRELGESLLRRLAARFAPGGFLHDGQGKWYPGEPLPRWALGIWWRTDGIPLWRDPALIADTRDAGTAGIDAAMRIANSLAIKLGLDPGFVITAYEDVPKLLIAESALPDNVDPLRADLSRPDERARLARLLQQGIDQPAGYVLPLKITHRDGASEWHSSPWPLRRERLYAVGGDSPLGLRLPLASLPDVLPAELDPEPPVDPFAPRAPLPKTAKRASEQAKLKSPPKKVAPKEVVKTALCVETRRGHVHLFMPPLARLDDYVALLSAIEASAGECGHPVAIEGYTPPRDPRVKVLNVTPDPGVIEVNVHPASSWDELVAVSETLYEEARQSRLGTEKFMLDGRHMGTGGGNHITLGGATPADSPLLRRPDLLRSLITYWQNHPSLSYLFSGLFIGPTSQAPRVDEARDDRLYELEIAFQQMGQKQVAGDETPQPWLVDRLLRHLLTDLTGNTHRAEFSIDKLYALPMAPTGVPGEYVAGVRFRAWAPPSALHPTIGVQAPLVFDLVDTWAGRALGGCTYHVAHPGGRSYDAFPVNANEAEARRVARFWANGHTPGPMSLPDEPPNSATPTTLDLRWAPQSRR